MKSLIAVDPGASGGIAWMDEDAITHAEPMPEGMSEQADFLSHLSDGLINADVFMERTGTYMPGNSGPASVKFARHCGHLDAILYMSGLPVTVVAPAVWMKSLGALPKEKPERKRAIKELMARRFPTLTVTLKTADALGILEWARSQYRSS